MALLKMKCVQQHDSSCPAVVAGVVIAAAEMSAAYQRGGEAPNAERRKPHGLFDLAAV